MGVFMHNEQHLVGEEPGCLAYEHQNIVELDGQLASAKNFPSRTIPEILTSDVEHNGKDIENVAGVIRDYDSPNVVQIKDSFLQAAVNISGVIKADHDKRQLEDDVYLFCSKRQKQVEQSVASYSIGCCTTPKTVASVDCELKSTVAYASEDIMNETSNYSMTCSNSEEDTCFDLLVEENFYNNHYKDQYQASGYCPEAIYSSTFDYFPRKHVAIGPNHQADLPELKPHIFKDMRKSRSDASVLSPTENLASSCPDINEDNCAKWVGSCIMPMPDLSSLSVVAGNLHHKSECSCLDEGSLKCVRQHIMEARQNLRKTLGEEDKFEDLGFCDMGEDLAHKWTEDEEQLFHKVVLSNPASIGKNFWDYLPEAFPTRTIKELVSYYFNVFMLRKRALQNRLDPLNADSDNDGWQESDDGEFADEDEEEEEDSVVESPADQGDVYEMDGQEDIDIIEETKHVIEPEEYGAVDGHIEGSFGVSEGFINDKSNFLPDIHLRRENMGCYPDDHDFQDDSCTSYEGQKHGLDSNGCPADALDMHHSLIEGHQFNDYRNDGLSGVTDHGFFDTHCDSKAWDMSYNFGSERDDFLSTRNVIKEVLGEEAPKDV